MAPPCEGGSDSSSTWLSVVRCQVKPIYQTLHTAGHGRVSEPSSGVADRLVEDRQAEREFVLGGGQWRGGPEKAAHAGELYDVYVHAPGQTAFRGEPAPP